MEVGFYMVERFNRQVGRYGWTKTKTKTKLTAHQKLGFLILFLVSQLNIKKTLTEQVAD